MHYFIDGYNLLFRFLHDDNKLSDQREAVIHDLNTKIEILELEVTLVFDAQYQLGETSRSHYDNLEILFSGHGETADDLILEEIKRELRPRQVVVVTSDKKLAWFARRCSAKTESVEFFMDWLNRRYKNKLRALKNPKSVRALPSALSGKKHSEDVLQAEQSQLQSQPQPKVVKVPSAKSTPEECFDYYLDLFQSEANKIIESRAQKKQAQAESQKAKPKRKGKKPPERLEPPILDHTDRWLKIFEQKLKDPDKGE
jgi:hypothetical protein